MWTNAKEIPHNNKDDDGNGFVDDVHGWNFADGTADLTDEDGHGTHIAGLIVRDAALPVTILPVKYYKAGMSVADQRSAFLRSLRYAMEAGAQVINISGGGHRFSAEEYSVLSKAGERGIVVVSAAGNKVPHSGNRDFFPAAYNLSNVISVVGTDAKGHVLPTSNVNAHKANRFELGLDLVSSLPGNRFGKRTGSSQAAALFTAKYLRTHAEKILHHKVVAFSSESLK
jgi:subtilisin family serine protease